MRVQLQTTAILIAAVAAGYVGGLMSPAPRVDTSKTAAPSREPVTIDVVRARKFELMDSADKVRGAFGTSEGEPNLILYNSAGKVCGLFSMVKGEPGLALADSAGEVRGLFVLSNGEPGLSIRDSAGKPVWSAP